MKVKESIKNAKSGIRNKILSSFLPKDIKVTIAAVLGFILLIVITVVIAISVSKSNQSQSILVNEGEKCTQKLGCGQDLTCFAPLLSDNATAEFGTCVRLPKTAAIATYCKNSTDGPHCANGISCQFTKDEQFGIAAKCVKI